jgi:hypothetical protein
MIFLNATLHFTVLLVIHFLGQKSHCASATANSVVIINERTNLDPLRSLDKMEQILSTDRTRLSVSKSSDAIVKSFELKTGKKKKIIRPSPLPTRMPAIDKVVTTKPTVQVPKKGPPTKEDVTSKPSTAAGSPSKPLPATDKVVTTKPTVQVPKKGPPTKEDVTSKPSTAAGSKTVIGVPTTAIPNGDDSTTVINAPKEGNVPDDDNIKTSDSTDKPSGTDETGTGTDGGDDVESDSGNGEPASKDDDKVVDTSTTGGGSDDGKNGADGSKSAIGAGAGAGTDAGTDGGDDVESDSGNGEPASKDDDKVVDTSTTGGGSDDGKNGADGSKSAIGAGAGAGTDAGAGAGAGAGTDGNGQPEVAKAATPTYQPSSFQSPEKHLEKDTLLPVSLAPTAPTKGNKKGKFHKPTAQPIASKVNPSPKRSPPPTPPGATSVRSGSDPVDVTLVASEKSALTTVKYFFYTFMACVAVFGFIFCIRRYGPWTITGFITLPCYFQNVIYRVITLTLVSSLLFSSSIFFLSL